MPNFPTNLTQASNEFHPVWGESGMDLRIPHVRWANTPSMEGGYVSMRKKSALCCNLARDA